MIDEYPVDSALLVTWGREHRCFNEVFRTHTVRQ